MVPEEITTLILHEIWCDKLLCLPMSPWTPEIPIDDNNRHQNTDCVHDECKQ